MKYLLKAEEAIQFIAAIYLVYQLPIPGWLYGVLFIAPDISMLAYLINNKIGAICYNLFHHKGIAIIFWLTGMYFRIVELQFIGLLLFGHSAFDRLCGYGLKHADNFKNTHLGWIGKS